MKENKIGKKRRIANSIKSKRKESIWRRFVQLFVGGSLEAYGFSKRDIKRVLKETR